MKTAFAVWNNRIAPVFDVARRVILVESESPPQATQTEALLPGDQLLQKAQRLSQLGAESLVCGAISRSLQALLIARGIRVVPFVAGDVQAVIAAWFRESFEIEAFSMPGCRRRNSRQSTEQNRKEVRMKTTQGSGTGRRGGRGRAGQGRCRQDRTSVTPSTAITTGECVCTQCGHTEVHEQGKPCLQKKCSQCGAVMSRR
jgi:predicted Fe-Mo cluster-binding NifX family protein